MKTISIVTSCYNEEANIELFVKTVTEVMDTLSDRYTWELIIADNCSTDNTRSILRDLASNDRRIKCIFNSNNFGVVRSSANALMSATGDAVVTMCSDLQDPPRVILDFIREWENGNKVVCGVKAKYGGSLYMTAIRKLYYAVLNRISEIPLIKNFHGFGLYDRCVIEATKKYKDPYPYFRGIISEVGFKRVEINYEQAVRKGGRSSYNLFDYFDYAVVGCVNYSKMPLHFAVFSGLAIAIISLITAFIYLVYKLLYWDTFSLGLAPLVIGLFFFSAIQLIFIGLVGEYIGAIWTQVKNKPLVIEEERINF